MSTEFKELETIIKEYTPKISSSAYFGNNIPKKKLDNAIAEYASQVDSSQVIALIDTTVGGSAKEGIVFTTVGMYGKIFLHAAFDVEYKEITSVEVCKYKDATFGNKQVYIKKDYDRKLKIVKNGDDSFMNTLYIEGAILNMTPFKEMLEHITDLCKNGLVGETDKYIILEDMDEKAKYNYIRTMVNFSSLESEITAEQVNSIYSLMSRIKVNSNERKNIWTYISEQNYENIEEIIKEMDTAVPNFSVRVLRLSLIKDILKLSGRNPKDLSEKQKCFIEKICTDDIGDVEIQFLYEAIQADEKLLSGKINDKEYAKLMTDIGAKAASIGVPIAAIYLSGSVVGLSAAGITSGLAALGLGGVLGLSSMVTGVGVAVIIGMGVHKLIKGINGYAGKDKANKREYLMTEAIKLNQITITHLIEDICCLNIELVDLTYDLEINKAKISKVAKMLKTFSDALRQSNLNNNNSESNSDVLLLEG